MFDYLSLSAMLAGHPKLTERIKADKDILCPKAENVFKAFTLCKSVRVVILGQDPYHTEGKASGLAFGYHKEYKGPVDSSLRNILDEVYRCTGQTVRDTSLEKWAEQGVLLLNTRLTTTTDGPMKHAGLGWEEIIREVIEKINNKNDPIVWMLWGNEAKSFRKLLDNPYHLILDSSHPCRYSANRGFIGCGHFDEANEFFAQRDKPVITWGEMLQ